jgi:hypothetical protein
MSSKNNDLMNKALAFACRSIPYKPELRSYCKSVTACILMTQLDFWFASMPDGFYKFLSPCNHYAYKPKDSWTEELGFSEDEFRSAYEHIGVKYASKTKYQEALDSGIDPFKGKCYLAYRDVVNGLTYFLRNHAVANAVVESVVKGYKPAPVQETPQSCFERNRQIPETGNSHPQTLAKPVSGDGNNPSLLISNHKMTTKDDSSNGAVSCQKQALVIKKPKFAAAELSSNDLIIQSTPSALQAQHIQELAEEFYQAYGVSKDELAHQIIATVTNCSYFSDAGKDFLKKFNTIKKVMRAGMWAPPAEVVLKADEEKEHKINDIKYKIRMEKAEISGVERDIAYGADEKYLTLLQKKKEKHMDAIRKYEIELAKYQNQLAMVS